MQTIKELFTLDKLVQKLLKDKYGVLVGDYVRYRFNDAYHNKHGYPQAGDNFHNQLYKKVTTYVRYLSRHYNIKRPK